MQKARYGTLSNQRQLAKPIRRGAAVLSPEVDPLVLQRAVANSGRARSADMLALQRMVGNRAVTGLIQAKLTLGPVGGQNANVVQRNDDVESFAALSASDVVMAAYQNTIPKKLTMELAATYKSSFDKTGFGTEYWATETANWVLHTHRGAAGGLKAGKIKNWTERFSKGKGGSLTVDKLLKFPGVKQVDNQRKDESGTID